MDTFEYNFTIERNENVTNTNRNLTLWLLKNLFYLANYEDSTYQFQKDDKIKVTIDSDLMIYIHDQTTDHYPRFSFSLHQILQEYYVNHDASCLLFSDIFKDDETDIDKYSFLDKLMQDMSFTFKEDYLEDVKKGQCIFPTDIMKISTLNPSNIKQDLISTLLTFIKKYYLKIDAFEVFTTKAYYYLNNHLTDIEQGMSLNLVKNFNYVINEFNHHIVNGKWITSKKHKPYSHLDNMDIPDFEDSSSFYTPNVENYDLKELYWDFKCQLLSYFGYSDPLSPYINDEDIRHIWNIYQHIDHWKMFCAINKIGKDFKYVRHTMAFSRATFGLPPNIRQQITDAVTKGRMVSFKKFVHYPSRDGYSNIFLPELTKEDHLQIVASIEKHARIFTIADIIDYWKAIHKRHVKLSEQENTFTFASLLLD